MDDIDLDELFGEGENTLFDGMDDDFDLNEIGDEIMGAIDSGTGSQFGLDTADEISSNKTDSDEKVKTAATSTADETIDNITTQSASKTTTKKSKRNKSNKSKKNRIKETEATEGSGMSINDDAKSSLSVTVSTSTNISKSSRKSKRRTRSSSAKDTDDDQNVGRAQELDSVVEPYSSSTVTSQAATALHSNSGDILPTSSATLEKNSLVGTTKEQKKKRKKKNKHKYDELPTDNSMLESGASITNASSSSAGTSTLLGVRDDDASGEPPPKKKLKGSSCSVKSELDASSSSHLPLPGDSSRTSPTSTITKTKTKTKKSKRRSSASIDASITSTSATERQSSSVAADVTLGTHLPTSVQKSNLHELFDRQLKQQQLKTAPVSQLQHPSASQHHPLPPQSMPVQQLSSSKSKHVDSASATATSGVGGMKRDLRGTDNAATSAASSSTLQEGTPLEQSNSLFYPFCVLPSDIHYGARKYTRTFPLLDQVYCSLIPGGHHKREHDNSNSSSNNGHMSNADNNTSGRASSAEPHNIDDAKATLGKLNLHQVANELKDAYDILMRQRAFLAQSNVNMQQWCQKHFKQYDYSEIFGTGNDPDGKAAAAMAATFRSQAYGPAARLRRSSSGVHSFAVGKDDTASAAYKTTVGTTTMTSSSHFVPSKLGRTQVLKQMKMSSLRRLCTGGPPRAYTVKVKCGGFKPPFEFNPITQKKQKRTLSAIVHIPASTEEEHHVEDIHTMSRTIVTSDIAEHPVENKTKIQRVNEPALTGALVPDASLAPTEAFDSKPENRDSELDISVGKANGSLVSPIYLDQTVSSAHAATSLVSPSTVQSTTTTAIKLGDAAEATVMVEEDKEDIRQKRKRQRMEDDQRDWIADYKKKFQLLEDQISKSQGSNEPQDGTSHHDHDIKSLRSRKLGSHYRLLPTHDDRTDNEDTKLLWNILKGQYLVLDSFGGNFTFGDDNDEDEHDDDDEIVDNGKPQDDSYSNKKPFHLSSTSDALAKSSRKNKEDLKIIERKKLAINFALGRMNTTELPLNPFFDSMTTTLSSLSEERFMCSTKEASALMTEHTSMESRQMDVETSKSLKEKEDPTSVKAENGLTVPSQRKNGKMTTGVTAHYDSHQDHHSLRVNTIKNADGINVKSVDAEHRSNNLASEIERADGRMPNLFDRLTSLLVDVDDDSSTSVDCGGNENTNLDNDEANFDASEIDNSFNPTEPGEVDVSQLTLNERAIMQLQAFDIFGPEVLDKIIERDNATVIDTTSKERLDVNGDADHKQKPPNGHNDDSSSEQGAASSSRKVKEAGARSLSSFDPAYFLPHCSVYRIELLKRQHNKMQRSIGQSLGMLRSEAFRHIDWLCSEEAKKSKDEIDLTSQQAESNNSQLSFTQSPPSSLLDQWQQHTRPLTVPSNTSASKNHVSHTDRVQVKEHYRQRSIETGSTSLDSLDNEPRVGPTPRIFL